MCLCLIGSVQSVRACFFSLVIAFSVSGANQVNAYAGTGGQELLDYCEVGLDTAKTNVEYMRAAYCTGFISAIVGSESTKVKSEWRACIPTTLEKVTAIKIFQNYADRHPEQLAADAAVVVILAFREAYPGKWDVLGEAEAEYICP